MRKSALAHVRLGDLRSAIVDLSKVLAVQPDNKEMLLLRASLYEKTQQHSRALVDLRDAKVPERLPSYVILPDATTAK